MSGPPAASRGGRALTVVFALLVGLVLVGQVVTWSIVAGRGLDTTDEGYYLNVISHPRSEVGTALWFGAVLHGPWVLLGQNVSALRLVGAATTLLLGVLLARDVLRHLSEVTSWQLGRAARRAAALGMGLTSLLVYAQVPTTPSYATVAFWALALASMGLARWLRGSAGGRTVAPAALVGASAALLVLSKPTSAVLLVAAVLVVLALRRPGWVAVPVMALSGSTVLALVLTTIRLSPASLVERTRLGLELADLLGGHPHLVRWDAIHAPKALALAAVLLSIGTVAGSIVLSATRERRGLALAVIVASVLAAALVLVPRLDSAYAASVPYALTVVWLVPAAACACAFWRVRGREQAAPRVLPMALLLAAMPTIHAFGTNTNYWTAQARGAFFWVCAGVLLVGATSPSRPRAVLPHIAGALVALVTMSALTVMSPYRGEPPTTTTHDTQVGPAPSTLGLTAADSSRLSSMRHAFHAGGGAESTPLLDLTGESPGYVWALGALPSGQGWVIGGYPGSRVAAEHVARSMGCRAVAASWLLVADGAPRSLGADPLVAVGLDLPRDFEVVGSFTRSFSAWGTAPARVGEVELLRPRASATSACSPRS